MRYLFVFALLGNSCSGGQEPTPPPPGRLINLHIETTLVPSPAAVDVLLPPGYERLSGPVPVLIWLHGGISGRDYLKNHMRPFIEQAWAAQDLVPCVVVAPVTGASFYIDWHDGTNQWDTFITGQMLALVRNTWHVKQNAEGTAIGGSSFGGQGPLRIAFRHPTLFAAAASIAPGFPAVLKLEDWDVSYFGSEVLADHGAIWQPGGPSVLAEHPPADHGGRSCQGTAGVGPATPA